MAPIGQLLGPTGEDGEVGVSGAFEQARGGHGAFPVAAVHQQRAGIRVGQLALGERSQLDVEAAEDVAGRVLRVLTDVEDASSVGQ